MGFGRGSRCCEVSPRTHIAAVFTRCVCVIAWISLVRTLTVSWVARSVLVFALLPALASKCWVLSQSQMRFHRIFRSLDFLRCYFQPTFDIAKQCTVSGFCCSASGENSHPSKDDVKFCQRKFQKSYYFNLKRISRNQMKLKQSTRVTYTMQLQLVIWLGDKLCRTLVDFRDHATDDNPQC